MGYGKRFYALLLSMMAASSIITLYTFGTRAEDPAGPSEATAFRGSATKGDRLIEIKRALDSVAAHRERVAGAVDAVAASIKARGSPAPPVPRAVAAAEAARGAAAAAAAGLRGAVAAAAPAAAAAAPAAAAPAPAAAMPAKTMIMVCGTDGSGTRSAVKLLQSLGVTMAVDDTGTMDIHAERANLQGWPSIVKKILPYARSGGGTDYRPSDLPAAVHEEAKRWVERLLSVYAPKGGRAASGGDLAVSWGFKAPVSMHLVPVIAEVLAARGEGLRVLHVVRDGRDISFSGNQSPVRKFWDLLHPAEGAEAAGAEAAALRLWDENNVGAYRFGERHAARPSPVARTLGLEGPGGPGDSNFGARGLDGPGDSNLRARELDGFWMDYMALRIEDLVFAERKVPLVQRVAAFVGADAAAERVCCVAKRQGGDMGSHSSGSRGQDVRSRYGKWRAKMPGLAEPAKGKMASAAAASEGLRLFGYEPQVESLWKGAQLSAADCAATSCPL